MLNKDGQVPQDLEDEKVNLVGPPGAERHTKMLPFIRSTSTSAEPEIFSSQVNGLRSPLSLVSAIS